ncbi:MAG: ATP-grasp domain-containing protein [Treponema sp.]|nr:ATP-grasp domain-containing protein [Treponema sp.]
MKIVIFSTNSNHFDGNKIATKTIPSCKEQFDELCEKHAECEFVVITQLPGMFLLDLNINSISEKSEKVRYIQIPENCDTPEQIANLIIEEKPDIAIAATFWTDPFDWLTVKDGLVAEIVAKSGIKTIAHPSKIGIECFDKFRTHNLMEKIGLRMAKSVYIHHWLFICAGTKGVVKENVYAEYVLEEIRNMHFPVIIKDTVGLSSYGMQVVNTFDEAKRFLYSKRNSSDRIVEEMISGLQFGAEVHGTDGKYKIMPPMMFSVNQYGITSPKQSVKIGPVTDEKYKIRELTSMLQKMAEELELSGIAQVDLVFSGNEWYIIEINPRLSGMTTTYAAMEEKSVIETLTEPVFEKDMRIKNLKKIMNFKLPLLSEECMKKISGFEFVKTITQIENYAATQKREVGYAEIIIDGSTFEELMGNLKTIKENFPEKIEEIFFENAKNIINTLSRS